MMTHAELVRHLMTELVPFNRVLGIEVTVVEAERVEVILPASPHRLNHVGTVHAVAQFGLGEATAGTLVISSFPEVQEKRAVPLAASATIRYRRPASGDLRGIAMLPVATRIELRKELEESGKTRFTMPVQIFDLQGTLTTELEIAWVLRLVQATTSRT